MKKLIKLICSILVLVVVAGFMVGCSDASVVSSNLSTAADQFEINRRVVL